MNFEQMTNLMQEPGVTVRKYCSMPLDEVNMCSNEAAGELTVETEEGTVIPLPVCEPHLKAIASQYDVYSV